MRVINLSSRHSSRKLLPLVDFAASRGQYSALATLTIRDHLDGTYFTGGLATHFGHDPELALIAPSLIELTLSHNVGYPAWTQHSKQVGDVCVRNFQEEFLFVLAHEVRHIDQFWGLASFDEDWAEMDAERFAVETLKEYKLKRKALHIDLTRAA